MEISTFLQLPSLAPRFSFSPGCQVFTIGSCFARNIEEELASEFILPTMEFQVPVEEWTKRPNGLLNEYNPASIAQRLMWATTGVDTAIMPLGVDKTAAEGQYKDRLLAMDSASVNLARLKQRRRQIDGVYARLCDSEVLVITLGYVECWFDTQHDAYLNRNPDPMGIRAEPDRYVFKRLNVETSFHLLRDAIAATIACGIKKILLTVSPVPIQTTFSGQDCITANLYSKSVLREVARLLSDQFKDCLDYFPSYEIVLSGGLDSFIGDRVHVKAEVVAQVVSHLRENYVYTSAGRS